MVGFIGGVFDGMTRWVQLEKTSPRALPAVYTISEREGLYVLNRNKSIGTPEYVWIEGMSKKV